MAADAPRASRSPCSAAAADSFSSERALARPKALRPEFEATSGHKSFCSTFLDWLLRGVLPKAAGAEVLWGGGGIALVFEIEEKRGMLYAILIWLKKTDSKEHLLKCSIAPVTKLHRGECEHFS